ncbi:MAG: NUDIX domain-containing protein [Patescibacteria group bacterium]|nr:NUDIX domain-containing protein [Patescibacteria group bacterium]
MPWKVEKNSMIEKRPKVAIKVMILKEGKVLLGKRRKSFARGEYEFPGGHFEYMESFEECARRETHEECDMEIKNIRFQFLANVKKYAPRHYVHIGLIADWKNGDPKLLEPDECESWEWCDLNNLPSPLFGPCKLAIDSYLTKNNYYTL